MNIAVGIKAEARRIFLHRFWLLKKSQSGLLVLRFDDVIAGIGKVSHHLKDGTHNTGYWFRLK